MARKARETREGPACPICEASLRPRHCKYVCPNHGVVVDCSDPFV
jgi:hypothetical protein